MISWFLDLKKRVTMPFRLIAGTHNVYDKNKLTENAKQTAQLAPAETTRRAMSIEILSAAA